MAQTEKIQEMFTKELEDLKNEKTELNNNLVWQILLLSHFSDEETEAQSHKSEW